MLVLGLEAATQSVGVAIGKPEGIVASFYSTRERRHAETLAPAIDFVCRQAQVELSDIDVVAVDVGPGSFTGLRVGVATAKAIAYARRIPMVGLCSLDLIAHQARITDRLIVSMINAGSGDLYYAIYRRAGKDIQRIIEPRLALIAEITDQLQALDKESLIVGDGAERYAHLLESLDRVEVVDGGLRFPTADSLVEIATLKAIREEFVPESEIQPLYIKPPSARARNSVPDAGEPS